MIKAFVLVFIITNVLLAQSVGMVKTVSGTVKIKRVKKTTLAKVGTQLENGDIILTKAKSSVGITFDDGSRVSLGENAIFLINKFKVKPSVKEYDVDLELKKGKAVFSSGKIGKLAPKSVKFRIPTGVIGIRGTKFAVEAK